MPRPELKRTHGLTLKAPARAILEPPRRLGIVLCLGLAILTAVLVSITGTWWCQSEIQRAETEVKGGQIGSARARLERLARLGLGGAEIDYWLGACEEAEGHVDAALAAWARIPVGSPRFA